MPISKPGTWENGFKNSPQAETTQLREMGLYLSSAGEFETLDTTWCNVLNKTPTQFYTPSSGWQAEGIFLTSKGIGIGINPMRPDIDFLGTYGTIAFQEMHIFDPGEDFVKLILGNFNNSTSPTGVRAGISFNWDASRDATTLDLMEMYPYDYDATAYRRFEIDGAPLKLNLFSGSYIQMFDSTGGNVAIGGSAFGSSANFNLALYNGTAPGSEVDGVSLYALGDGFFVRGGTNKTTTLGDTKGNMGVDFPNLTDTAFPTNAVNNLAIANGTAPGANITGVQIYAESGAAKVLGSGGTTTTFGAADPHCQRCGRDFAMEWENEKYGKLSICAWCLSEKFEDIVIEKYEGGN
jgi:hypothetical protein